MIRVTIELYPHGLTDGKQVLSIIDIANDGTGTPERGNYKVRYGPHRWIEGVVTNWPRQSYSVNKLLWKVLSHKYD